MRIRIIGLLIIGIILYSCGSGDIKASKKIVECIDNGVSEKREFWGYYLKQGAEDTFQNFENHLLIKGHLKSTTKEEYRKLVDDVVANPEKYPDIYDHVYHHDQYVDTKIIFNPDFVLLYCPSTVIENEKNEVLFKQLEIMQKVLETNYGDKESVSELFKVTPSENFNQLAFRIPIIYMVLLKTIQFHTPTPGSPQN